MIFLLVFLVIFNFLLKMRNISTFHRNIFSDSENLKEHYDKTTKYIIIRIRPILHQI